MNLRTKPKGIALWMVLMLLCITVQPVMAWGSLTQYSIDRNADEDLYHFAHNEVSNQVLYGSLDYPLIFVADNDAQERWGTGWMTHITADRSAHGHSTYYPVDDDDCYYEAAGGEMMVSAFGSDVLSYWYHEGYDTYYPQAVEDVEDLDSYGSSRLSLPLYGSSALLDVSDTEEEHTTMVKVKMEVGRQLIDEGLLIPHKEVDVETGDVTISIKQTVGNEKLVKTYKQYLGESTERHTGEKSIIVEVIDDNRRVTIDDIKSDHPDLYQKLTENGWVNETGELVEKRPHDR